MEADFRQFYGLYLGGMGADYPLYHAAVLCAQLPAESRVAKKRQPETEWSDETYIIWKLEHDVRLLSWGLADSKTRGKMPEPLPTPYDRKMAESNRKRHKANMARARRILGIGEEWQQETAARK